MSIEWKNLAGQERIKEALDGAVERGTLGHAYLFCGEKGVGKFQAALELAMALLCSNPGQRPCYVCEACKKALHCTHPDLHIIVPVFLESKHRADNKLSQAGWEHLSVSVKDRVAAPYALPRHGGVPTIPVEWVREVNHAIMRGPLSGGRSITIIDGVDIMEKASANALLKTLEEPPAGVLIVLVTDRPQALLPTIVSRCQTLRFGCLPPQQVREAVLSRCGGKAPEIMEEAVRYGMGSLGRALLLCESPAGDLAQEAMALLEGCMSADWLRLGRQIDALAHETDFDRLERLLLHTAYLVRSGFLRELVLSGTYIDMLDSAGAGESDQLQAFCGPGAAAEMFRGCQEAISAIKARGNVALVLVNFVMTIMENMHGKKQ